MGTIIDGRYQIKKSLPEGNMSTVFLCNDIMSDDNEIVAVKVFNKVINGANTELQNKIFYREVESLERADHLNIVKIIDKGYDEKLNSFYIVLEYVSGKNLGQLFDVVLGWEFEEKMNIICQITEAVCYLHQKNIIHRDLKPSNILISDENVVKIIDFGVSKIKDTFYNEFTVVNFATPKYAAPEQLAGKQVTTQSDIYSLGKIYYEVFSGEILNQDDPIQLELVPIRIRNIISTMLEDDIEKRYKSLSDVKKDINKIGIEDLQNKSLVIKATNKLANKLFEEHYISRKEVALAIANICRDFEGKVFLHKGRNENSYMLIGRQFVLICCIDKENIKRLSAVDIRFFDASYIEMLREQAIEIPYKIKLYANSVQMVSNEIDANDVLEESRNFFAARNNKKNEDIFARDITNKWKEILKLQRKNLEEAKSALKYEKYTYHESDDYIDVELDDEHSEIQFTHDDLLSMTDRYNFNKSFPVGYMHEIRGNQLRIMLSGNAYINRIAPSGEISIDKQMIESALNRQEKALRMVQYGEIVNPKISEIIYNPLLAKNRNDVLMSSCECASKYIDEPKLRSLEGALGAEDLFLLQGPPGTGKTTFISELVYQILTKNSGSKILIASQSNVAVDNSLSKIKELLPSVSMIRIGIREKFSENIIEYTFENFCRSWENNVIKKCAEALEVYKETIGIDQSIFEKNSVITEIEDIVKNIREWSEERKEIQNKKVNIDEQIEKWSEMNLNLENIIVEIMKEKENPLDISISKILEDFSDNIQLIRLYYSELIEKVGELSYKKIEFEKELKDIEARISNGEKEISEWKDILDVKNADEYEAIKNRIQLELKENQKKYNQLFKIESICKEWQQRVKVGNDLYQECLTDVSVVGATCLGITNLSSKSELKFDWVIIDEAGKATPPEILVPIGLGKKIILVGDHKQLPPVIDSALDKGSLEELEITKEDLEKSLFEYLEERISPCCKSILNEQYRMHPVIGKMVSEMFYKDVNLVSKTIAEEKNIETSLWGKKAIVWLSTSKKKESKEEVVNQSQHKTFRNICESDVIFEYLMYLDKDFKTQNIHKKIGIIAGYRAQRDYLSRVFESRYHTSFSNIKVEINTVDAFQGRETDIIFYSVVRCNNEGNIGFLSDIRRLNVAFSRARELLIIVGNHDTVTKKPVIYNKPNPFYEVIHYIYEHDKDCCLREV